MFEFPLNKTPKFSNLNQGALKGIQSSQTLKDLNCHQSLPLIPNNLIFPMPLCFFALLEDDGLS